MEQPSATNRESTGYVLPDASTDPNKSSSVRSAPANVPSPSRQHRGSSRPYHMNSGRRVTKEHRPPTKGPESTSTPGMSWAPRGAWVQPEPSREVELKQAEFFNFLDRELAKLGAFYKQKEDEATHRLQVLRDQLHIMREQSMHETMLARRDKTKRRDGGSSRSQSDLPRGNEPPIHVRELNAPGSRARNGWIEGLSSRLDIFKPGFAGKGREAPQTPGTPVAQLPDQDYGPQRDGSTRPFPVEIPYNTAKQRLAKAMAEYYRGLELLKSYSLLNRKAFYKMSKKYDKAVGTRQAGRYMREKVNAAYFVKSDVLDGHIRTAQDLYARYFEGGNRKIAAGKLKPKSTKPKEYDGSVFRSGVLFATGLVFGIQGMVSAIRLLSSPNQTLALNTNYLLQVRSFNALRPSIAESNHRSTLDTASSWC